MKLIQCTSMHHSNGPKKDGLTWTYTTIINYPHLQRKIRYGLVSSTVALQHPEFLYPCTSSPGRPRTMAYETGLKKRAKIQGKQIPSTNLSRSMLTTTLKYHKISSSWDNHRSQRPVCQASIFCTLEPRPRSFGKAMAKAEQLEAAPGVPGGESLVATAKHLEPFYG